MGLRLSRRSALLVLCCLVPDAAVAQPVRLGVDRDRDPAVLSRLVDDWRVGVGTPALTAAIVSGDSVVWAQGFGIADLEQGTPARPETVFRIASISKPIAATAVMQLVERGLVSLEDPIQKYVPSFPRKPQGEVRLRHLLTHTSGIRHYAGDEMNSRAPYATLDHAFTVFKDDPLLFAPGEKYSYTTYGFNLLAGVVESVTRRSFDEYVRQQIFAPAGMTTTWLERPQDVVRGRGGQYVRGSLGGTLLNAPYADLSVKWAGGGIISTVLDLARFDIALNQGRLLRAETLEQMYTSARLTSGARTGYGLGWSVNDENGRVRVAHAGGATGGTTYLLREPKSKLASVILTNLDGVPRLRELAEQLLALAPRSAVAATR